MQKGLLRFKTYIDHIKVCKGIGLKCGRQGVKIQESIGIQNYIYKRRFRITKQRKMGIKVINIEFSQ